MNIERLIEKLQEAQQQAKKEGHKGDIPVVFSFLNGAAYNLKDAALWFDSDNQPYFDFHFRDLPRYFADFDIDLVRGFSPCDKVKNGIQCITKDDTEDWFMGCDFSPIEESNFEMSFEEGTENLYFVHPAMTPEYRFYAVIANEDDDGGNGGCGIIVKNNDSLYYCGEDVFKDISIIDKLNAAYQQVREGEAELGDYGNSYPVKP